MATRHQLVQAAQFKNRWPLRIRRPVFASGVYHQLDSIHEDWIHGHKGEPVLGNTGAWDLATDWEIYTPPPPSPKVKYVNLYAASAIARADDTDVEGDWYDTEQEALDAAGRTCIFKALRIELPASEDE